MTGEAITKVLRVHSGEMFAGDEYPTAEVGFQAWQEWLRMKDWYEASMPIVAALAVYGEGGVNLAALVQRARALNEAPRDEE